MIAPFGKVGSHGRLIDRTCLAVWPGGQTIGAPWERRRTGNFSRKSKKKGLALIRLVPSARLIRSAAPNADSLTAIT